MFSETNEIVRRLLQSRTVADFLRFPPDKREEILAKCLLQEQPVVIEEGFETYHILLCGYEVGRNDNGRRLTREAAAVYYRNTFIVRMHWLCEFMSDTIADGITPVRTGPMLRGTLIIHADIDCHLTEPFADDVDTLCAWTRSALDDLFEFAKASRIVLVLRGEGPQDGSDPATQDVLKDIAPVIRRLLTVFGERFEIKKDALRPSKYSHSFRSYWNAPTDLARQRVRDGIAAFEEVMQVRIEGWIASRNAP